MLLVRNSNSSSRSNVNNSTSIRNNINNKKSRNVHVYGVSKKKNDRDVKFTAHA